jgi:TetR/AcrR family transcriptional regulator, cholesterol catabolism regulator
MLLSALMPTRKHLEQEIIRVAAEGFSARGYRATTLDDIAQKVGISKVTLYRYCHNKEELLVKVFERTIAVFHQELHRICAQKIPPEEKLQQIIRHQVRLMVDHRDFLRVFFSEESQLPPVMAERARQEKRDYNRLIEGVIHQGLRQGSLVPIPPPILTFIILGACNWLYQWYRPEGELSADEVARLFIMILQKGYLRQNQLEEDSLAERLERIEKELSSLRQQLVPEQRVADDRPAR